MHELKKKIDELEKAKNNILVLLNNSDASVDFHGLSYWAGEVERLRGEIKEEL